jgi:hypothetical protein
MLSGSIHLTSVKNLNVFKNDISDLNLNKIFFSKAIISPSIRVI